jgi:hypothetical protein
LSEGVHNKNEVKKEDEAAKGHQHKSKENGDHDDDESNDDEASKDDDEVEPLFVDANSSAYLYRDPSTLSEEQKTKLSCDEVFAIYLYEISQKINPEYYKTMIRFVLAYRECLNRYGWEKKAENDEVLNNSGNGEELETTMITPASDNILEKAKELRTKAKGSEFSVINNSEHAPEICNEFVTVFLQERSKDISLSKNESIDLTRNICHWLFTESYTCSKVSMIKS